MLPGQELLGKPWTCCPSFHWGLSGQLSLEAEEWESALLNSTNEATSTDPVSWQSRSCGSASLQPAERKKEKGRKERKGGKERKTKENENEI